MSLEVGSSCYKSLGKKKEGPRDLNKSQLRWGETSWNK